MDQKALELAVHQEIAYALGDAIIARIVAEKRLAVATAMPATAPAPKPQSQNSGKSS